MANIETTQNATKNRWITHGFLILFFQAIFFGSVFTSIYAIIALNYQLIVFLVSVSILQRFARRSQTVIDLVNKLIHPISYFRIFKRIYEEEIPDQEPAIFCMHPHSVLSYCMAASMNADNSKMSLATGLASRFLLALPFTGLQLRLWGVQSVNPTNITRLMKNKKTIAILPGGFQEAALTTPKQLRVFIKQRKGFLKYALKYGYTIYPVLAFNEHKAFKTFDYLLKFRLFLTKLKIPGVFFGFGFLWFFLPLNLDIITIVGKGIKRNPQNNDKPVSDQQLNQIHQQYMKQIERIHNKYRQEYGQSPLVFY